MIRFLSFFSSFLPRTYDFRRTYAALSPSQTNPSTEYKRLAAIKTDAYKKLTTRQKYGSNEQYNAFREGIHVR